MIASADDLERDEPDIAAVAGKIRAHGRELAALAAEVRRLRRQRPADVLAAELVRAVAGSAAGLSDAESRARLMTLKALQTYDPARGRLGADGLALPPGVPPAAAAASSARSLARCRRLP